MVKASFKPISRSGPFLNMPCWACSFGIIGMILYSAVSGLIMSAFVDLQALSSMGGAVAKNPQMMQMMLPVLMPVFAVLYLGLIFVFVLAGSYVITRQRKYIYDNSVLDNKISFASTLKARSLAWVSLTNLIAIVRPPHRCWDIVRYNSGCLWSWQLHRHRTFGHCWAWWPFFWRVWSIAGRRSEWRA